MDPFQEFETFGRLWHRKLLSLDEIQLLAPHCEPHDKPGARLPLSDAMLPVLGPDSALARLLTPLGVDGTPVRLVAFNKSHEANWGVPWHQDRVVAVKEQVPCVGYANWVPKPGFWHCEPPLSVLSRMLFVRIHFDLCDADNGAMEIALGSHNQGVVPAARAAEIADTFPKEMCVAEPGDVLVVKALTLHRSRTAVRVNSRRTLRVDYARRLDLDPRLTWALGG